MITLARAETDPFLQAEYERLAMGYFRLAEQADRNSANDIVYETPPPQPQAHQTQQQQQQQPEPTSEED
jgi:hypothetical protein